MRELTFRYFTLKTFQRLAKRSFLENCMHCFEIAMQDLFSIKKEIATLEKFYDKRFVNLVSSEGEENREREPVHVIFKRYY